jgi:hypothetical protein
LFGLAESVYSQSPTPAPTPIVIQLPAQTRDGIDYFLAVVQFLTLVGLAIYVYKTWQMASATRQAAEATRRSAELSQDVLAEMREARAQETAPYVLVYLDMPYSPTNYGLIYLVITNTGKTVAKNIKFKFEPTLQSAFGNQVHDFHMPALKEGLGSLVPNQEIRTVFDSITNYSDRMAKHNGGKPPMKYTAKVSYTGGLSEKPIESEHVLDISMFEEVWRAEEEESPLVKATVSMARSVASAGHHIENIADTLLKGIWLRNPDIQSNGIERNAERWKLHALAKLNEFSALWKTVYAGNYERPLRLYLEELQGRISIFSAHILFIASCAPSGISTEIVDAMIQIATRLDVLSNTRWLMNGEVSEPDFNSTGDEIVTLVNRVREMIGLNKGEDAGHLPQEIETPKSPEQ